MTHQNASCFNPLAQLSQPRQNIAFRPSIPESKTFKFYKQELNSLRADIEKISNEFNIFCQQTSAATSISLNLSRTATRFYSLCTDNDRISSLNSYILSQENIASHAVSLYNNNDKYGNQILKILTKWMQSIDKLLNKIKNAQNIKTQIWESNNQLQILLQQQQNTDCNDGLIGDIFNTFAPSNNEEISLKIDKILKYLDKSNNKYNNLKLEIKRESEEMLNGRYTKFDTIYVQILEYQTNFSKYCYESVNKLDNNSNTNSNTNDNHIIHDNLLNLEDIKEDEDEFEIKVSDMLGMQINDYKKHKKHKKQKKDGNIDIVDTHLTIYDFRKSISNNLIPNKLSITYDAIFNEYVFDNKLKNNVSSVTVTCNTSKPSSDLLLSPFISFAQCVQPKGLQLLRHIDNISDNNNEYYLSVSLNTNTKCNKYCKQSSLDLIICLDISYSMNNTLKNDKLNTKIKIAKDLIIAMISLLNNNDRFGLVLFNREAVVHYQLILIEFLNKNTIYEYINDCINVNGSRNIQNGFKKCINMFDMNDNDNSKRIVVVTDCDINIQIDNINKLISCAQKINNISTTFIGIDTKININLLKELNNIFGFNSFYINNANCNDNNINNLKYILYPDIFNIEIQLKSSDCDCVVKEIYGNYGNYGCNNNNGSVSISTLYPSNIIIFSLKRYSNIQLCIHYSDKYNNKYKYVSSLNINIQSSLPVNIHFDNNNIRKAILLINYIKFIHSWIDSTYYFNQMKTTLNCFNDYFRKEINEINDKLLNNELKIIGKILSPNEEFRCTQYNNSYSKLYSISIPKDIQNQLNNWAYTSNNNNKLRDILTLLSTLKNIDLLQFNSWHYTNINQISNKNDLNYIKKICYKALKIVHPDKCLKRGDDIITFKMCLFIFVSLQRSFDNFKVNLN